MDNLFEQFTNISKAHAYDIVSNKLGEVEEQNKVTIYLFNQKCG
jgi:hypothetical protein